MDNVRKAKSRVDSELKKKKKEKRKWKIGTGKQISRGKNSGCLSQFVISRSPLHRVPSPSFVQCKEPLQFYSSMC